MPNSFGLRPHVVSAGDGRFLGLLRDRLTGQPFNLLGPRQPRVMTDLRPIVFVIDTDLSIRDPLGNLIRSVGMKAEFFSSPFEFLQENRADAPSCLVLDIRLPGKSGLDFQRELAALNIPIPIIFLTSHGDIPMCVRAMKAGAIDFLTKPFRDQDLVDAIQVALERDRARRQHQAENARLRDRLELLTPRERAVLPLVVSGLLNKQIAAEIGTTEATVKVHRSQLMKKVGAASLPDLVRMADRIGISSGSSGVKMTKFPSTESPRY
jgi:FixJ family two-component response regulator